MSEHQEIIDRAKRAARSAKRATQLAKRVSDQIEMNLDTTISLTPETAVTTAPDRRRRFGVIEGGRNASPSVPLKSKVRLSVVRTGEGLLPSR